MKSQKGSVHVVITIILVVALIAALGFIFWQNFVNKATVKVESKNISKEKQDKKPARSASWLVYKSQNNNYSIAIPDSWTLTSQQGGDDLVAWTSDKIRYEEGKNASVEVVDGGRDGSSIAFYLLYDYKSNQGSYLSPDLKKVSSFTTSQGIEVEKSTRTQQAQPEGMDIPYGTQEYVYDLHKGDIRIHIVHDVLIGETEQTSLVEEMIDTLTFL